MPKGNTTQNRGRGPAKGTGGRPITGSGVECRIRWPVDVAQGLKDHRQSVIEFVRILIKTQTA